MECELSSQSGITFSFVSSAPVFFIPGTMHMPGASVLHY